MAKMTKEQALARRRERLRDMDEDDLRLQRDPQIQPDIRYRHLAEAEWDRRQEEHESARLRAEVDRLDTENAALRQENATLRHQVAEAGSGHGWTKAQVLITAVGTFAAGATATALVYANFIK